jgi:excisionase family DNA binding protein
MTTPETISKADAAKRLNVSAKWLERRVGAGQLTAYKKPGKTGLETHFALSDIEAIERERQEPMLAPRAETRQDKTPGEQSALVPREQIAALLELFTKRLPDAARQDATRATVAVESKAFLTIAEAVALSGLGRSQIEAAIKAGQLKARSFTGTRGRRIHRSNLDAYLKKL